GQQRRGEVGHGGDSRAARLPGLVDQLAQLTAFGGRQPRTAGERQQQRRQRSAGEFVGERFQLPADQFLFLDARRELVRERRAVAGDVPLGFEPFEQLL